MNTGLYVLSILILFLSFLHQNKPIPVTEYGLVFGMKLRNIVTSLNYKVKKEV